MNAQEAAQIIDAIVNSIKDNPQQFQFTVHVTVTGMSGTAYGGGVGIMGIAQGGGTGIHSSASVDGAQVKIAQKKGETAVNQQIQALVNQLSAMSQELRSPSPDKSKLKKMYDSLKGEWVPSMITSVVSNLISGSLTS